MTKAEIKGDIVAYKTMKHAGETYYIVSHDFRGEITFLVKITAGKYISVVCEDKEFAAYALRHQGVSFNISFGKKLKELYKEIIGKEFTAALENSSYPGGGKLSKTVHNITRPDESIGIELFAHVYYLLIAYGLRRNKAEMTKMMTRKDKTVLWYKGVEKTVESCRVADLDIYGGNSIILENAYLDGTNERLNDKRGIYKYLEAYLNQLTAINKNLK